MHCMLQLHISELYIMSVFQHPLRCRTAHLWAHGNHKEHLNAMSIKPLAFICSDVTWCNAEVWMYGLTLRTFRITDPWAKGSITRTGLQDPKIVKETQATALRTHTQMFMSCYLYQLACEAEDRVSVVYVTLPLNKQDQALHKSEGK